MTKKGPPASPAFFNPFPKYLQVRHILERRLYSGYELGDQLPTEQALCEEFGVSRETVREALRGLEQEGIIQRHRAKGTFFVRRPDAPANQRLTGMVEDFTALHLDTYAKVLSAAPVKAADEAKLLHAPTEDLFHIERLRYFENRPLVVHEAFLPPAVGERIMAWDLGNASIQGLIEDELRIVCIEERQQIEAMIADTRLAQLLDVPVGAPVLLVSRLHRLSDGSGMVLFRSYYRADRYYYTLNLSRPGARP
ncbi:GntR family transcriptional regulator [Bordetella genomosp. 13]|uniref:GntR family transcriptional regulator n=1 Tax=Bordetella genomosp. 13 TaxID=463040 RepID=UPI001642EB48|nr:GntR family transcriptional regulator [Bordetella genomosp. 13]